MKQNKKQDLRAYLRFLKNAKLPWLGYFIKLGIGIATSTITIRLYALTGDIMNGDLSSGALGKYIVGEGASLILTIIGLVLAILIGSMVDRRLQKFIWKKFIRMPLEKLDETDPATLPGRLTSDIKMVGNSIDYFFTIIELTYSVVLVMMTVWQIDHRLTLTLFSVIPVTIFVALVTGRLQYKINDRTQTAYAGFMGYVTQGLNNMALIKAFSAEEKESARGSRSARGLYKANMYGAEMQLVISPLTQLTGCIAKVIVLVYGVWLIAKGYILVGSLVELFLYLDEIEIDALQYVYCWSYLKQAQGGTATVAALTGMPNEQTKREASFSVPDADIRFSDVTFRYAENEILHGASFTIPKGKITAIIGPSGAGKTTILSLLERFYQPASGRILFGNTPAEHYHLDEWRKSFAYVPQSSPLFSGTIRENICYGIDGDVREEELIRAARIANIYDFIQAQPQCFDTPIGQSGCHLSGGERQRIAIARAAILNPDFLLLDEATCNLDATSSADVQKALRNLMEGRTCVIVTHDMRAVKKADHIVVINNGTVEMEGTHEQLLANSDFYRSCCELQAV